MSAPAWRRMAKVAARGIVVVASTLWWWCWGVGNASRRSILDCLGLDWPSAAGTGRWYLPPSVSGELGSPAGWMHSALEFLTFAVSLSPPGPGTWNLLPFPATRTGRRYNHTIAETASHCPEWCAAVAWLNRQATTSSIGGGAEAAASCISKPPNSPTMAVWKASVGSVGQLFSTVRYLEVDRRREHRGSVPEGNGSEGGDRQNGLSAGIRSKIISVRRRLR